MATAPLITVATINFNGESTLGATLASVCSQAYTDFEYIVIDGGSTDRSVDLIESFRPQLSAVVSEPDAGIADAMNKALRLARGQFILFLHSDDTLLDDDALARAARWLEPGIDIYLFDIMFGDDVHREQRRPRGINFWMNFKTGAFHQATFCARDAFDRIGPFDTRYRIAMDYDWFLRAYRAGLSRRYVPEAFSFMRNSGVSSQLDRGSLGQRFAEERAVHRSLCRNPALGAAYALWWWAYPKYRGVDA